MFTAVKTSLRPPPSRTPRSVAPRHRWSSLVGAGLGLAVFLVAALVPSLVGGAETGFLLAGGIFGSPTASTAGLNTLIVLGMVLGATATGAMFAATGAVAGAALGALTRAHGARRAPAPIGR